MKPLLLPILSIWVVSQVVALAEPTPWLVANGGNGHSYEAFHAPNGITWANAQADAVSRGGYLATITSAAENSFAYGIVANDISYWYVTGSESWGPWLGGLQPAGSPEPGGGWTWVTGEAFTYANWAGLQPNNSSQNENRIQFTGHNAPAGASTWNDLNDSATTYVRAYIVEFNTVPEPSCSVFGLAGLAIFLSRRRTFCQDRVQ